GWHNWSQPDREQTSRYAEFASTGPAARTSERLKWAKQLTETEAKTITLERVLSGADSWNPKTGTASFTNMNAAAQTPIVLWPDGAPGAVGILGSSAGGHLAATIATHFDSGKSDAGDPIERPSSRPNLLILLYPVITMREKTHAGSKKNLLGENPSPQLIALLSNDEW